MNQIIHSKDLRKAAVISANDAGGPFRVNTYVNCNPTFPDHNGIGEITLVRYKAKTLKRAQQWAANQMAD